MLPMSDGIERLDWGKLLSDQRLQKSMSGPSKDEPQLDILIQSRMETERDFDRILFATPTRRLGDKTQVFPLDRNESVRTRLTHSHEVANLARSIGTHIVYSSLGETIIKEAGRTLGEKCASRVKRSIPAILAAVGLAHDLGNPPFGHQGEEAIRNWIVKNDHEIFSVSPRQKKKIGDDGRNLIIRDLEGLSKGHREDFRKFEGNAQTLRTLMRLQVVKDERGLNLTFGTLAALMKYTVGSQDVEPKTQGKKGICSTPA
jgi:dGTPase